MIRGRPTLLITDDDRALRETLAHIFDRHGLNIQLAADGVEAIDVAQREEVHVVLIDLHMPRISGLAAVEHLHRHSPQLPCILISGTVNDEISARAKAANVVSVLPKPLNYNDTIDAVWAALRESYSWQPTGN